MAVGQRVSRRNQASVDIHESSRGILNYQPTCLFMKTNLRTPILFCVFAGALVAIWLQSPAPRQPGKLPLVPAKAEVTAGGGPLFLRTQSSKNISALEKSFLAQTEPPDDPDEIIQWARENPQQALVWMTSAGASTQRDAVAEIVCPQVAEFDPAQSVTLAERYASVSSVLHENMMQQWAEQDSIAAYAYATNKPAGDPRDRLLNRVAFVLAKENPAAAAKIVAEEILPGGFQEEAAMSVLHQWALRDASAAGAWAQSFPDGALRDRAMREVHNVTAVRAPEHPDSNGDAL